MNLKFFEEKLNQTLRDNNMAKQHEFTIPYKRKSEVKHKLDQINGKEVDDWIPLENIKGEMEIDIYRYNKETKVSEDIELPQEIYEIDDIQTVFEAINRVIENIFSFLNEGHSNRLTLIFYFPEEDLVIKGSYEYKGTYVFFYSIARKENLKNITKKTFYKNIRLEDNSNWPPESLESTIRKILDSYLRYKYYRDFRRLNEQYPLYLSKKLEPFDEYLRAEFQAFIRDEYKPTAQYSRVIIKYPNKKDVEFNNNKEPKGKKEHPKDKLKNEVVQIKEQELPEEIDLFFEDMLPRELTQKDNWIQITDKLNHKGGDKKDSKRKFDIRVEIEEFKEDEEYGYYLVFTEEKNIKKMLELPPEGYILLSENLVVHNRKKRAVELLKNPILTPIQNLVDQIVRPEVFSSIEPEEIIPINPKISKMKPQTESQYNALCLSYTNPDVTLIQGPPGSGKTTLIVEIVQHLCRMGLRVLMVAPTHIAIDNIIERLDKLQNLSIQMVRIGRINRIEGKLKKYQLKNIKNNWKMFVQANIMNYISENEKSGTANEGNDDISHISEIQKNFINNFGADNQFVLEDTIINSSNLVCGTSSGVVSIYGDNRHIKDFDVMIIDESSKATVLEFLIPATRAKKWIIIGDQHQLPPYFDDREVRITLQNRFNRLDIDKKRLNEFAERKINLKKEHSQDLFVAKYIKVDPFVEYLMQKFKAIYEGEHYVGKERFSENEWEDIYKLVEYDRRIINTLKEFIIILGSIYHYFYNRIEPSRKITLNYTYRMPEIISKFLDENIYRGSLKNAQETKAHGFDISQEFFFNEKTPFPLMTFLSTSKFKDRSDFRKKNSTSSVNRLETKVILQLLRQIHATIKKKGINNIWRFRKRQTDHNGKRVKFDNNNPLTIGIITFYGAQFFDIRRKIKKLEFITWKNGLYYFKDQAVEIKLSIVDRFQGQEKDIIIIPLTRSNSRGNIGFLKSIQRINVAFSRAIHNLFIIGDHEFFERLPHNSKHNLLINLINYVKKKRLLKILDPKNSLDGLPEEIHKNIEGVIIDGANVSRSRSKSKKAIVEDIYSAIEYCENMGYDVEVIVSDNLKKHVDNIQLYEKLLEQPNVSEAPEKEYDDIYIIKRAHKKNYYILSNDKFSDNKFDKYRAFIQDHKVGYVIFPDGDIDINDLYPINKEFENVTHKLKTTYKKLFIDISLLYLIKNLFPDKKNPKYTDPNKLKQIIKNISIIAKKNTLNIIFLLPKNRFRYFIKTCNDINNKYGNIIREYDSAKDIKGIIMKEDGYFLTDEDSLERYYKKVHINKKLFFEIDPSSGKISIFQYKKGIKFELK